MVDELYQKLTERDALWIQNSISLIVYRYCVIVKFIRWSCCFLSFLQLKEAGGVPWLRRRRRGQQEAQEKRDNHNNNSTGEGIAIQETERNNEDDNNTKDEINDDDAPLIKAAEETSNRRKRKMVNKRYNFTAIGRVYFDFFSMFHCWLTNHVFWWFFRMTPTVAIPRKDERKPLSHPRLTATMMVNCDLLLMMMGTRTKSTTLMVFPM